MFKRIKEVLGNGYLRTGYILVLVGGFIIANENYTIFAGILCMVIGFILWMDVIYRRKDE